MVEALRGQFDDLCETFRQVVALLGLGPEPALLATPEVELLGQVLDFHRLAFGLLRRRQDSELRRLALERHGSSRPGLVSPTLSIILAGITAPSGQCGKRTNSTSTKR
jgi:hypothetical protein